MRLLAGGEGMKESKLTCPSESPQHPTPPFPITVIIADHRSHAFLLELPRPLCSLVTHPETYGLY